MEGRQGKKGERLQYMPGILDFLQRRRDEYLVYWMLLEKKIKIHKASEVTKLNGGVRAESGFE